MSRPGRSSGAAAIGFAGRLDTLPKAEAAARKPFLRPSSAASSASAYARASGGFGLDHPAIRKLAMASMRTMLASNRGAAIRELKCFT